MVRSFSSKSLPRAFAAVGCALVGALSGVGPPAAHAQEAPTAQPQGATDEDLIAEGVSLRKRGQDADALAVFERAYALRPSARAAAQIGLARQAQGEWLGAERGLVEALRAADDPWVAPRRPLLEDSLRAVQEHLGWVQVESNVAGSEVWVSGELRGHVPLEGAIRVAAGDVPVVVRAPPRAPLERVVYVRPTSSVRVSLPFGEDAPASPAPGSEVPKTPSPRPPPSEHPAAPRVAGWITLGGAGALALLGTAGWVTREVEASIYNDDGRCGPIATPSGTISRYQRCGTNREIGSAAQTFAIGAFAGAGAAAALSAVLLFRRSPPATSASIACDVVGAGLLCRGSF